MIDRAEREISSVADVRGDAGPELLDGLDQRNVRFIFRLPTNETLARMAEPFARRLPGHPTNEPRTWCHELAYCDIGIHPSQGAVCTVQGFRRREVSSPRSKRGRGER